MKKFLATITAVVLLFSTTVYAAPSYDEVTSEVKSTAAYLASSLDASSLSMNDYQKLLLISAADIERTTLVNSYLELVKANMKEDKTLSDSYNTIFYYAAILNIMAFNDIDATDFNGCNLVNSFVNSLDSFDFTNAEAVSNGLYYFVYVTAALNGYKNYIADYNLYLSKIKTSIMENYQTDQSTGACGIMYYYSISPDNNASVLPALYFSAKNDPVLTQQIINSVNWTATNIDENGLVNGGWGTNVDSTSLTLLLLSVYPNENVNNVFNGVLTYKDSTHAGAYLSDYDALYATTDALYGLLAYQSYIHNSSYFLDYEIEYETDNKTNNDSLNNIDNNISNSSNESTVKTADVSIYPVLMLLLFSASIILIISKRNYYE